MASPKARYSDSLTLTAARALFFARSGLGPNGDYDARWVRIEMKPFPMFFPNTRGRVKAVRLHDLHHIATEYGVDWAGEVEIAAWEVAGGCGPYVAAWLLNLGAMVVGLFLHPVRMWRAFRAGRGVRNLYYTGFDENELATTTVGELRRRLVRGCTDRQPRNSARYRQ